MRKKIEWDLSEPKSDSPAATAGIETKQGRWRDAVFSKPIPRLKFTEERTWLRFFPTIKGGENKGGENTGLFTGRELYDLPGIATWVRLSKADDILQAVRIWFYQNRREALYSKANPKGHRFWGKPTGFQWAILPNAPEGERLKMARLSLYEGDRGGSPGLGHTLVELSREVDVEPGSPTQGQLVHGDLQHPETGRQVLITRTVGGEYASYKASVGKQPVPIAPLIEGLTEPEQELLAPVESLFKVPTREEQIGWIKAYLGDGFPEEALADRKAPPVVAQPDEADQIPM
jgi:hypothetical protein